MAMQCTAILGDHIYWILNSHQRSLRYLGQNQCTPPRQAVTKALLFLVGGRGGEVPTKHRSPCGTWCGCFQAWLIQHPVRFQWCILCGPGVPGGSPWVLPLPMISESHPPSLCFCAMKPGEQNFHLVWLWANQHWGSKPGIVGEKNWNTCWLIVNANNIAFAMWNTATQHGSPCVKWPLRWAAPHYETARVQC